MKTPLLLLLVLLTLRANGQTMGTLKEEVSLKLINDEIRLPKGASYRVEKAEGEKVSIIVGKEHFEIAASNIEVKVNVAGNAAKIIAKLKKDLGTEDQAKLIALQHMATARSDNDRRGAISMIKDAEENTPKLSSYLAAARASIKTSQKTAPPMEIHSLGMLDGNIAKVEDMIKTIMAGGTPNAEWPKYTASLLAEPGN